MRSSGFLVLTSLTVVAIPHAAAWLGAVGKFLGLVLLVIQLASADGTVPWQTIPEPLYVFHPCCPWATRGHLMSANELRPELVL